MKYIPKIGTAGVWDMRSVIQIKEFHGVIIARPQVKRKREAKRQLTIAALGELVPSNFGTILSMYQEKYFYQAKKFWLSLYPNINFPLEFVPTTESMKSFVIFALVHTLLQLSKTKEHPSYIPHYTLPKIKHFDNATYFSKFIVFVFVNRATARCGWDYSFLSANIAQLR